MEPEGLQYLKATKIFYLLKWGNQKIYLQYKKKRRFLTKKIIHLTYWVSGPRNTKRNKVHMSMIITILHGNSSYRGIFFKVVTKHRTTNFLSQIRFPRINT